MGRPSPATGGLDALVDRRCRELLAAAPGWIDDPNDEALAGARRLAALLRVRAALAGGPDRIHDLLPSLDPALADELLHAMPPPAQDSFDDYVGRLAAVFLRFARPGAPPASPAETARYGHLRARSAGLRSQGDVALWVALQALLGRNFHSHPAHRTLMDALTAPPRPYEGPLSPDLRRELTRSLRMVDDPPPAEELEAVRLAQGPAPPPERPPWHPPSGPW